MSSTVRRASTVRRGEWVTEMGTPGGPFHEAAADCDGVSLTVYVDPLDHGEGTVTLPLRLTDGVRVWVDEEPRREGDLAENDMRNGVQK